MDTRLKTLAIALIALAMVTAAFSTADARDAGEGGGIPGPMPERSPMILAIYRAGPCHSPTGS